MEKHNIVIIGGGPAGMAAAVAAYDRGARDIVILERDAAGIVRDVYPKIETGEVKPTIYKVLPITEAEAAHDILYRGENVGKVVLTVNG